MSAAIESNPATTPTPTPAPEAPAAAPRPLPWHESALTLVRAEPAVVLDRLDLVGRRLAEMLASLDESWTADSIEAALVAASGGYGSLDGPTRAAAVAWLRAVASEGDRARLSRIAAEREKARRQAEWQAARAEEARRQAEEDERRQRAEWEAAAVDEEHAAAKKWAAFEQAMPEYQAWKARREAEVEFHPREAV